MVELHLYVEGGGSSKALQTQCRAGFRHFLEKAGLAQHMPRVVASGSRESAYDNFKTAIASGKPAMLLVDSEAPVSNKHHDMPWKHLAAQDRWAQPKGAEEADCHLMVQCMESWLIADRDALKAYFGTGFRANALPSDNRAIESLPKADLFNALDGATKDCKTKGSYGKSEHSFELLACVDPEIVTKSSPWASRFVAELKRAMRA